MRLACLSSLALLALGLSSPTWGDEASGPGRRTLVEEPWGTIFCADSLQVRDQGDVHRVASSKGPITVSRFGAGWMVQAPNQNLQVRPPVPGSGRDGLLVTFNASRFWFETKANEYIWNFPAGKTYFTLREGEVRGALGNDGGFTMHKHAAGISYNISSEAGESEVLVGRRQRFGKPTRYVLVKKKGEDLTHHPYLVRGVVFDNGPVGVFIRLPGNPVLAALPWNLVQKVATTIPYAGESVPEAGATPAETTITPTGPAGDTPAPAETTITPEEPRADPLRAVESKPNEDPLKQKRKPFEKDRSIFNSGASPAGR